MSRFAIGILLLIAACEQPQPATLAIRSVTVVDVTDGSQRVSQTVLVDGNWIVAVGPADEVGIPEGADVVDASGGYLIPGLWDTHVHSAANLEWHFPLYLAHGVTSVRNMHTSVDDPLGLTSDIKRRLANSELTGPRFLANGGIVDGYPPVWGGTMVIRNEDEARDAVNRLVDGGADFIKVYNALSPDAYFAIMDQAERRGISVDGHVPLQVDPQEAAAAGQRTIEHTSGMTMGCSARADSLRTEYIRYLEDMPDMAPFPDAMIAFYTLVRGAMDTRDPELCLATARSYREHGVAVVPTLFIKSGLVSRRFVEDSARAGLLPQDVREAWSAMAAEDDPLEVLMAPAQSIALENVRILDGAGVTILAGTDVGNPFLVPGLSLHEELEALAEAGLDPLEILRAATLGPARVFDMADSLGTVETGKLADLVVLDGDPLQDITNTRRIRAVVVDGHLFRRDDLDRLLAESSRYRADEEGE